MEKPSPHLKMPDPNHPTPFPKGMQESHPANATAHFPSADHFPGGPGKGRQFSFSRNASLFCLGLAQKP
jgi:hypothetical protein